MASIESLSDTTIRPCYFLKRVTAMLWLGLANGYNLMRKLLPVRPVHFKIVGIGLQINQQAFLRRVSPTDFLSINICLAVIATWLSSRI